MMKEVDQKERVDFIIVGAMKCGTTSLADLLNRHPRIALSVPKEPQFFTSASDWPRELARYHACFPEKEEGMLWGEASTNYTKYPHFKKGIWRDMYAYNPELRIIYLVRDPLERILSHYVHAYESGYIDDGPDEALIRDPSLLDISRYALQIRPFIETFGRDRVDIIDMKDLKERTEEVLRSLSEFLRIDPGGFKSMEFPHSNPSIGNPKLHKRFKSRNRFFMTLRSRLPGLWKKITANRKRAFQEKPNLKEESKELIDRYLDLDRREMEGYLGKDLGHWLHAKKEEKREGT